MAADIVADDLRRLMSRYPAGVSVLTVASGEQRLGLTVGSLVSLSLDPPLVGFAVSRQAAMHELLREAGGGALSLLAAGQEWLAEHFARGVPPIAMWAGIELEEGDGAPLLARSLGWLRCRLREELDAHTHTFFSGAVTEARTGVDGPALVRIQGGYRST